jgi:hypothetical protein
MHHPGEVWIIPPEEAPGGDPKWRRHLLFTRCEDGDGIAILAYASTQSTERHFGATCYFYDPAASEWGRRGYSGFSHPTHIYPSRLINAAPEDLHRQVGRLVDEMADLRQLLRQALGIGTGTESGDGAASGSWRGRIVRLEDAFAEQLGAEYGLVVTEPRYSCEQRYQILVPVFGAGEVEPEGSDITSVEPWSGVLLPGAGGVVLAVAEVQTAFHPHEIRHSTGVTVDAGTMGLVDDALLHLLVMG